MKALIALDPSPHSRRAVEYAADILCRLPGSEVHLLALSSTIPPGSEELDPAAPVPELHGAEDHQRELQELRDALAEAAARLRDAGLPAGRVVESVQPLRISFAQDIVDAAEAAGCDTIVVGRRGLSTLQELFQGSVSAGVVHKATGLTVWVVE